MKIKDGFLCGKCVAKCSEHILNTIRTFTVSDIRKHLAYRHENKTSERFQKFRPDITLGKHQTLQIDSVHRLWSLNTNRPFRHNDNPDIFSLSQIKAIRTDIRKECINKFEKFNGKLSRVPNRLRRKINRTPLYGYWFYIMIDVQHEMFSTLTMRLNQYIITDWNKETYQNTVNMMNEITRTLQQLSGKAGNSEQ